MKKIFDKNSIERMMFIDFWEMCQDFWIPEGQNDSYWKAVLERVYQFTTKYSECSLSMDLAMSLLAYLERQSEVEE